MHSEYPSLDEQNERARDRAKIRGNRFYFETISVRGMVSARQMMEQRAAADIEAESQQPETQK